MIVPATEQEVQAQVERLAGLAERPLSDYSSGTYTAPAEPFIAHTIAALRALPPVSWLIDRVLVAVAFVVLYGASGVGKTFAALDFALTVASGSPWHGHTVAGGWVLYISAEGSAGLTKRIDAWCEARDQSEPERIRFVTDAPNLLDPEHVQRALATIAAMPETPVLIVVDTMARTMVGGDENSARDVGQFIHALDCLRQAADGATALVIHHTGKRGDDERGSSSLRGAADQMLALTGDIDGTLQLAFDKLKDFEAPNPLKEVVRKLVEL
jgi:RecA-family ATPase